MSLKPPTQSCPNCFKEHDVSVYVTGQRVLCTCGIRFEVRRNDGVVVRQTQLPTRLARPSSPQEDELALGDTLTPSPKNKGAAPVDGNDATYISVADRIEIPGYVLKECIGRGGMGEVWRADQTSLSRTVAVKILPSRLARDTEFVTRFEKEATALAALSHPNIVQIIDRGVSGEHYYFAMEFVEGRSLRDVLNQGRVPVQEALGFTLQILGAIDYAHKKQIIHRDLKPENILIDDRGHIKIADFGLAGMRGSESKLQLTATSVAMGTVNYMAPEQRRDAKNVDARADLYSVGVMFYELLTGDLPVGRFRMPTEKGVDAHESIDEVLGKMLEPEPNARFPTAAEAYAALEPLVDLEVRPTSQLGVRPGSLGRRVTSRVGNESRLNSRRVRVGTGVAVVLLLAVAAAVAKWGTQSAGASSAESGQRVPPNTDAEVFVSAKEVGANASRASLQFSFQPGKEELNAHAGQWWLEGNALRALQAGNEVGDDGKLVPRTYVAHRYFSTNDFFAEVEMNLDEVPEEYVVGENPQKFGELAIRIKDLQVSVFAIPDAGMRLGWRYFTADGVEVYGNSARDLESLVEDEVPVPKGPFRVRLVLRQQKNGVDVEAFLNGRRFVRKALVGLENQTGKIALGCRNLSCRFSDLMVSGQLMTRPGQKSN